jgi:hypothetical protein
MENEMPHIVDKEIVKEIQALIVEIDQVGETNDQLKLDELHSKLIKYIGENPIEYKEVVKLHHETNEVIVAYTDKDLEDQEKQESEEMKPFIDFIDPPLSTNERMAYKKKAKVEPKEWANDIENQIVRPAKIFKPESLLEIQKIVIEAKKKNIKVKSVGRKHSYSTIVQATESDFLILPNGLDKVQTGKEEFTLLGGKTFLKNKISLLNKPSRTDLVETQAGISVKDLNKELRKLKKALKTMGAYSAQCIAGLISTSTHGSRHDYGPIPDMVQSMLMVVRGGELVRIEPKDGITNKINHDKIYGEKNNSNPITLIQDDKTFYSALVNMGAMGVIYSLVVEVDKGRVLGETRKLSDLYKEVRNVMDKAIETVDEKGKGRTKGYNYMCNTDSENQAIDYNLLVNPYPNDPNREHHTCIVTRRKIMSNKKSRKQSEKQRSFALSYLADIKALTKLSTCLLRHAKVEKELHGLFNTALNGMACDHYYIADSSKVFLTPRPTGIKGLAMEITMPFRFLKEALKYALYQIKKLASSKDLENSKKHKKPQLLTAPISVRFVRESKAYLSQFTATHNKEKNGFKPDNKNTELFFCMEFPMINGTYHQEKTLNFLQEKMCEKFGTDCRVHWGLNFGMTQKNYLLDSPKDEKRFPKIKEWLEVYADLNEDGIFSNEFTTNMGFDEVLKKKNTGNYLT